MRRQGFILVELMVVVAIIGILVAIAIPNFRAMQHKAKRAEVPANVSGIWVAEIAYEGLMDAYIAVPQNPGTPPGRHLRDFEPFAGWQVLGWDPDGQLRGSYSVDITATTFTVFGESDVDGDGVLCLYSATDSDSPLLRAGDEGVF